MLSTLLTRADRIFGGLPRNVILVCALVLAILLGLASYYSGTDLLVLYMAPIFLASWYGGHRPGMVVAIYCAGAILMTRVAEGDGKGVPPVVVGEFIARLVTYLFIARVVSRLRESRKQQEELTQFIVHDLRSPISSSITGLMTLEQMAEDMGEVEREMVSLALVSNQRALTLVNSILDVSKLETGKMTIKQENVRLEPFIDDCLNQVALWANSNGITLRKQIGAPMAHLDPELTARVLVNLLSNALKFSRSGSFVTLSVSPSGRDALKFGVHDQGPGIPPEYVDTIFEPFAQVAGTKGGTGLGLTFCRLAIQAQGGRIWVESALGKGTSMLFVLPHQHVHENEETVQVPLPGARHSAKVD
jgi:signal transduction histidine kinase